MSEQEQQQAAADATRQEQEQKRTASICPCCHQPTLPYPVAHVPDELADQFMACLISGTPFTHVYPLYNGKVRITVTQMTAELRTIVEQVTHAIDRLADSGLSLDDVSFDTMKGVVRSLISVPSIEIQAGALTKTFQPQATVKRALEAFNTLEPGDTSSEQVMSTVRGVFHSLTDPAEVSGVPPIQIMTTIEAHARLLDILMDSGFDANFWAGIELA